MVDVLQGDQFTSGQTRGEWLAGTGEVLVSDDNQRGYVDACELFRCERLASSLHDRRERHAVVAGLFGVLHEEAREVVLLGRGTLERANQTRVARFVRGFDRVATDARHDQLVDPSRMIDRQAKKRQRTERKTHRGHRFVGQNIEDPFGEVGVTLGIVGFGCVPMTQEVDSDHPQARVLKQISETGGSPRRVERPTPAMHQNDRMPHTGQDSP